MNQAINTCITGLNNIGQGFWDYAVSIFVQSSVLIVLLLIIDFLLRKRVRAVFRYCVWMLVFVKLLLPTSFALPTGIGYWLADYLPSATSISELVPDVEQAIPAAVPTQAEVVTLEPAVINETVPAEVKLEAICWQGLVFLGWLAGVLVLSALLIQRVWFVKALVAQSKPAKGRLLDTLNECRWQIGIRKTIELRLSDNMASPAVCGLFKPMILMPTTLLEKLSLEKLKAVLIHELAHIKRRDVWVNLMQTVLQIVYFYNPFVWLANAMVRRVREQAVDEMVLVTLRQEAKSYSNTLIDIAEMAFWKPNLGLRLIGVVESKSSLKERIKIMLNRPIPKSAKVGVIGTLAVIVTGAILLPMTARAKPPENSSRVVHFPRDWSLGRLMIQDASIKRHISTFHHWVDNASWYEKAEYLGEARGDVKVPAGKRLALFINNPAGWRDLSPLAELRPDDLYMLHIFGSHQDGPKPDDRCMKHIAHLTGLKILELNYTNITTKGIKHIKEMKSLERLTLGSRINSSGLAAIGRLKSLKGLYLRENKITNAGLKYLTKLTSLEELAIGGGRIGDEGLVHLAKLPRLRYLMLTGENFSDDGMVHLKNIPSLKILHIGHLGQITDAGLVHLSDLSKLENLTLHWNENITDQGIAHLKKMQSLKKLDIGHAQITDEGLAHLTQVKSLDYLDLPNKGITDKGLSYLTELTKLKHLSVARVHKVDPNMDKNYYTDKGLKELSKLTLLEELTIGSIGITDTGMRHIAKLTNLKDLHIFGCPITNEGLDELATLKSLKTLSLSYANITTSGLSRLKELPNLTHLTVRQLEQRDSTLDISGLTELEKVSIGFTKRSGNTFNDMDLACLAKLKRLKWLQIYPRKFSDAGLAHLAGLTNIERLGIGGPGLTDDGLKYLSNMKRLNHLTISDGAFASSGHLTDKGLRHLEVIKALRYLNIMSDTNFSPAALGHLRKELPSLYTLRTGNERAGYGGRRARATKK